MRAVPVCAAEPSVSAESEVARGGYAATRKDRSSLRLQLSLDRSTAVSRTRSVASGSLASVTPRFGHNFGDIHVTPGTTRKGIRPVQRCGCGGTCSKCVAARRSIPTLSDVPEVRNSAGVPLPGSLRLRGEATFGVDLSPVRLHADGAATTAAARVAARAFTVDNDIYFGSGWYQPASEKGLRLLGHELTHVVQQRGGLSSDEAMSAESRFESEADRAASAFVRAEPTSVPSSRGHTSVLQRSEDPGADAERTATADSPFGLPFLGEVDDPAELLALMQALAAEAGTEQLGLIREEIAMTDVPATSARASAEGPAATESAQRDTVQTQRLDKPLQRSVVAGCAVPSVSGNSIGIAAHRQIQAACATGFPGCQGEFSIPNDGRADLYRSQVPYLDEIGEIKPASWFNRDLPRKAAAQLAGYLAAYSSAYPGSVAKPMWSFMFSPAPFILNPSQLLSAYGPVAGLYFYRCTGGTRRRVRVPVRIPSPVPVIKAAPDPSVMRRLPEPSTARETAKTAAKAAAGVGLGYLIYRGIRMLPSLFPAAWPTIPANLAIP